MLYRIQTEDGDRDGNSFGRHREYRENIIRIVSRYFDGFTLINTVGYWKGKPEDSIIIEIIADNEWPKIVAIADEIRTANKQECVLMSEMPVRYCIWDGK